MWQCPKCKSTELDVEVSVTVQLVQRGDDPENFETEYNGGDHLWDGGNLMTCRDCGHCDASNAFVVPEPWPEELSGEGVSGGAALRALAELRADYLIKKLT